MAIRVAINGYGRIGRNVLRAHYEYSKRHDIEIVAINNPGEIDTIALLTRYDTAHGKFPADVSVEGNELIVNGDRIRVTGERDPENLPWKELGWLGHGHTIPCRNWVSISLWNVPAFSHPRLPLRHICAQERKK